jgi:hypothetical protein
VPVQRAAPAGRTVADPAGYLVIHADSRRGLLVIEHYRNDGLPTTVTEAGNAADGYVSVLEAGLVSRLDHAAYLGRELARASTPTAARRRTRLATPARSPACGPDRQRRPQRPRPGEQPERSCLFARCLLGCPGTTRQRPA